MKLWKLAAPVAAALALTACGPSNSGSAGGPGAGTGTAPGSKTPASTALAYPICVPAWSVLKKMNALLVSGKLVRGIQTGGMVFSTWPPKATVRSWDNIMATLVTAAETQNTTGDTYLTDMANDAGVLSDFPATLADTNLDASAIIDDTRATVFLAQDCDAYQLYSLSDSEIHGYKAQDGYFFRPSPVDVAYPPA